jgi:ATP-dependent DNA helicase RecQ
MTYYCFTNECLRDYILRYFGEYGSNYCGNCENCLAEFEDIDATADALSFISLVKTSGERYGMNAMIEAAHGAETAKVRQFKLEQNTFYGALKSKTIVRIRQTANHLLVSGYLYLTTDGYPVLKVTEQGMELLQEKDLSVPLILKLPKEQEKVISKKKELKRSGSDAKYPELFERLRMRRYEIAQNEHMPPYIVFSDKALKEMSTYLPTTKERMLDINGVGMSKFGKYGQEFMQMIKEFMIEHEIV